MDRYCYMSVPLDDGKRGRCPQLATRYLCGVPVCGTHHRELKPKVDKLRVREGKLNG